MINDSLDVLRKRLSAAKARLRYHSRRTAGASKTRKPTGEARELARADVAQLTYFVSLSKAR